MKQPVRVGCVVKFGVVENKFLSTRTKVYYLLLVVELVGGSFLTQRATPSGVEQTRSSKLKEEQQAAEARICLVQLEYLASRVGECFQIVIYN